MEKRDILILALVIAFLAFRLYQKYIKKEQLKQGGIKKSDTSFPSSSNEDDYEPYSGK